MRLYRPTYTRRGKTLQSSVWWVEFRHANKRERHSTGCRDEKAAHVKAGEIVRSVEMGFGSLRKTQEASPLALAEEFVRELERRRRKASHIRTIGPRIRYFLTGVSALSEVTSPYVRSKLGELDLCPRTINAYLRDLNSFFVWLIREERWERNPCLRVERLEPGDPAERGVFSLAEVSKLVEVSPSYRALAYLVAATTGLRRSELGRLTWGDVDLDQGLIVVRRTLAKNKRADEIPLVPETRDALAQWREAKEEGEGDLVFPPGPGRAVPEVRTLRRDMEKAGLPLEAHGGPRDFHSLRGTLATALANSGVSLTLAQKLLRHSTPVLTANFYTRHGTEEKREALGRLLGGEGLSGRAFR